MNNPDTLDLRRSAVRAAFDDLLGREAAPDGTDEIEWEIRSTLTAALECVLRRHPDRVSPKSANLMDYADWIVESAEMLTEWMTTGDMLVQA